MIDPILIFGAGGQAGCEFMNVARIRSIRTLSLTREDADITSAEAVERAIAAARPRLVVNAAAYTAVDRAESEPDLAHAVNAMGAGIVAAAAASAGVPMLHISTDYVFDGSKAGPYVESDPIAPLGVYGRSKAEGEARVMAENPQAVTLRTAWVYGPYGHNFLKTMLRLAATRDELRVVGDQRGCPTATADIAEAILAVDRTYAAGQRPAGIFHFAGTGMTTWHGFAREIIDYQAARTGRSPRLEAITTADYPTPARRPANSELDSTLFARTFGYRARPWQERVRESIDILLNQDEAKTIEGGAAP